MKLLGSIFQCRFRFSTSLHYSTQTRIPPPQHDPLLRRIMPLGNPRVSIAPVLNQWVEDGQVVNNSQLKELIRVLRRFRRFSQALQASEWMSVKRSHNLSPMDIAVQLDLITKVRGIEEGEKYFDSIPDNLKVSQVYGAFLNSYVEKQLFDKAEKVMEKIRELGFHTTLNYNGMLRLYYKTGKYEKFGPLMEEMEERGVSPDKYTYNTLLNAYAASSDLESMEKLVMKMEIDPLFTMDWDSYVIAARGYLKANLTEKASAMLKKAEHLVSFQTRKFVYETILSLHAAAGNRDEVYRIWRLYKSCGKSYNKGYLVVIGSLVRLDDIDGAQKIFDQWASRCNNFDVRILNSMAFAYCKKGLSDKAEALVNSIEGSGKKPEASTWGVLASGYRFEGQMEKAVEMLKKVLVATRAQEYVPNRFTLDACHEYLKEKGDADAMEELLRLLRERLQVNSGDYDELAAQLYEDEKPSSPGGDVLGEDDPA